MQGSVVDGVGGESLIRVNGTSRSFKSVRNETLFFLIGQVFFEVGLGAGVLDFIVSSMNVPSIHWGIW